MWIVPSRPKSTTGENPLPRRDYDLQLTHKLENMYHLKQVIQVVNELRICGVPLPILNGVYWLKTSSTG